MNNIINISSNENSEKSVEKFISDEELINEKKTDNKLNIYPFDKIKSTPIITAKKELYFLYFSENDYQFFIQEKGDFSHSFSLGLEEEETKMIKLKEDIFLHFQKLFNDVNLEERIRISYSDKMKDIKPNYSFAIEMNDDFKNKPFIKSQINDYIFIKKDILKNLDLSKEKIISYDPFYSLKSNSKKNPENKKLFPKFAVSLIKKANELEDEDDDDDELINYRKSFYSNKKEDKKIKSYKDIITILFKINNFRTDIINYCLERDDKFKNDDFEKFICYLEYFVTLFTGIQVKYSIDELGLLNMDFYSNEDIFMNLAEILHYKVQFQIKDKSYIQGKKHTHKKLLIKLNNIQYEYYDFDKVEYFPVYTSFQYSLANNVRRYDENDNYHLCEKCMNIISPKEIFDITCHSSCFRFIDKTRLLFMALVGILNIGFIERMIKMEDNYINQIFKSSLFLRNESVLNNINDNFIFLSYISPIQTTNSKKLDNLFRNIFGEVIGYFYSWISHYLKWLIIPTLIGLIARIISHFVNNEINEYINIIFLSIMILWGFYYVEDWNYLQIFYNQIWGMNNFIGEKSNSFAGNYNKVTYVSFLGIKMEKVDKYQKIINSMASFILMFVSSMLIILINLIVFLTYRIENIRKKILINKIFSDNFVQYQIPILILILREIITSFIFKLTKRLANLENPTDKDKYIEIVTKKRLILEYINYYFNLYYIAFYKKAKGICRNNDCFSELRYQLMMILIADSLYVLATLFYKIIFLRNNRKKFERKLMKKFKNSKEDLNNNSKYLSIKFKIYTREEFIEENIQKLIIPIIFDFGYVIQFGACYPLCFIFLLISVIFARIADAFTMIDLIYVKTIEVSKGLKNYNRIQNKMLFIGIFTNIGIIFYTKGKEFLEYEIIYGLALIILIENGILLILKTFNFAHLPFWFRYKDNIELRYLKKFGVARRNKGDKIKDEYKKKIK